MHDMVWEDHSHVSWGVRGIHISEVSLGKWAKLAYEAISDEWSDLVLGGSEDRVV